MRFTGNKTLFAIHLAAFSLLGLGLITSSALALEMPHKGAAQSEPSSFQSTQSARLTDANTSDRYNIALEEVLKEHEKAKASGDKDTDETNGPDSGQIILSLGLVLGLAVFVLKGLLPKLIKRHPNFLEKLGKTSFDFAKPLSSSSHWELDVLQSRPIGPNQHLHIVQAGSEVILIGSSPNGLERLGLLSGNDASGEASEETDLEKQVSKTDSTPSPSESNPRLHWLQMVNEEPASKKDVLKSSSLEASSTKKLVNNPVLERTTKPKTPVAKPLPQDYRLLFDPVLVEASFQTEQDLNTLYEERPLVAVGSDISKMAAMASAKNERVIILSDYEDDF